MKRKSKKYIYYQKGWQLVVGHFPTHMGEELIPRSKNSYGGKYTPAHPGKFLTWTVLPNFITILQKPLVC